MLKIDVTTQNKGQQSLIIKLALLAVIGLLFLIPLKMIESVITGRQLNGEKVKQDISKQWAERQNISGPVLNIPVKTIPVKADEKPVTSVWHIMPETLSVNGKVEPEVRNRGIYQSVVYNSDIQIAGEFVLPETSSLKDHEILWGEAYYTVGISDNRGLKGDIFLNTGNINLEAEPGVIDQDIFKTGISFRCPVNDPLKKINFKMAFTL